jgi:hypothetical protein
MTSCRLGQQPDRLEIDVQDLNNDMADGDESYA